MKIVFVGDSLTEGLYGADFVAEIARRRPADTIINAGIGGQTVLNIERRLDEVIALKPDGLFLMVGGNDSISFCQPATRTYYRLVQGIPDGVVTPEQFAQTYRDILQRLQLAFIRVWVGLPPTEYNPETVASQRRYNQLAAEAAHRLNIPTLDLMAAFAPEHIPPRPPIDFDAIRLIGQRAANGWNDYESARKEGDYTYTFDGNHITRDSALRFAETIDRFIG